MGRSVMYLQPPPQLRARFRCPKCNNAEYYGGAPGFSLKYEPHDDRAQAVGERLVIGCNRCGYMAYEDCVDKARPDAPIVVVGPPTKPARNPIWVIDVAAAVFVVAVIAVAVLIRVFAR